MIDLHLDMLNHENEYSSESLTGMLLLGSLVGGVALTLGSVVVRRIREAKHPTQKLDRIVEQLLLGVADRTWAIVDWKQDYQALDDDTKPHVYTFKDIYTHWTMVDSIVADIATLNISNKLSFDNLDKKLTRLFGRTITVGNGVIRDTWLSTKGQHDAVWPTDDWYSTPKMMHKELVYEGKCFRESCNTYEYKMFMLYKKTCDALKIIKKRLLTIEATSNPSQEECAYYRICAAMLSWLDNTESYRTTVYDLNMETPVIW